MGQRYYSKDGGWYNTYGEMVSANTRYDQQQKQNKLLEEQNRLIVQQNIQNANLERKKMEHEKELAIIESETQKEMQNKQMEHDEKMRILRLFDDIGLNKEYYDNFLKYLFVDDIDRLKKELELANELKKNHLIIVNGIDKYFKNPEKEYENIKCLITNKDYDDLVECKNKLEEYLEKPNNVELKTKITKYFDKNPNNDYLEYKEKSSKSAKRGLLFLALEFIIMFGGIFICSILDDFSDLSMFIIVAISIVCLIFGLYFLVKKYDLTPIVEEEIKKLDKELSNPLEFYNPEKDLLKIKKESEEMIESSDNLINSINDILGGIVPKWNNFVEFRKKHYNSKFEKLLLDLNLKNEIESLGIEYVKINNNNKLGDGEIEDYITYFDELD